MKAAKPKQITYRNFVAHILLDRRSQTPRWSYLVQRKGEAEILSLGTCDKIEDCIQDAKHAMRDLAGLRKLSASGE